MENCLQCFKELIHVPGRKQKSFCNVNCRNKYFYAKRKQEVALAKATLSLPPLIGNGSKAAIALHNAENEDQFTTTHLIPKSQLEALNTPKKEAVDIQNRIDAIRAEKIPKERDTSMGRKAWQLDQHKRIQELQQKLL